MREIKYVFMMVLIFATTSCEILEQAADLTTFARCKFKLDKVENIELAGINVQNIKEYSQLSFMDIAKLTSVITGGKFPLNFTLNMLVYNPNQKQAAMNKLDWILLIDNIEMNRGVLEQRVVIPPGGRSVLPLQMQVDLKEVLSGETLNSLINFGLNLADATDKPTRISLKAKPTIVVAGTNVAYPDYITIKNEFR